MKNNEFEFIGKLAEIAMEIAELKAENKRLKCINEQLTQNAKQTPEKVVSDLAGSQFTIEELNIIQIDLYKGYINAIQIGLNCNIRGEILRKLEILLENNNS